MEPRSSKYLFYLESTDTSNLTNRINDFLNNVDSITQQNIDSVAKEIVDIFIDAAKVSGMCKPIYRNRSTPKKSTFRSKHKFFYRDCRQRRADYVEQSVFIRE